MLATGRCINFWSFSVDDVDDVGKKDVVLVGRCMLSTYMMLGKGHCTGW